MNSKNSYADVMGMSVSYNGRNKVGQFCFCNGSPLTTDVYDTIEEAMERFGKRIDTRAKEFKYSTPWERGKRDAIKKVPREPGNDSVGPQALLEYDLGYIDGMQTFLP